MTTGTEQKDKTSELAEQKLAQMEADEKAQKEQKEKEEAKGASPEKSSTEKEKTEGKEAKADESKKDTIKTDVVILDADDKDLNEEELARKKVLIQEAEDAKTPEEKLKTWQENTQKRIDELSGELKAEKNGRIQDAETIKSLEGVITKLKGDLENSGSIESESAKDAKTDEERYAKMVEEDKDLPREKRREMAEDELEEFLLESYTKANEWLVERSMRRQRERDARANSKDAAKTIDKSAEQFYKEFPGCNQEARHKELVAEGKTDKEAIEILITENEDFSLMMKLFKEHPEFTHPVKGPELLSAEMKKRKDGKKENAGEEKENFTKEEVEQMKADAVKAEQERIAGIDESLSNSIDGGKTVNEIMNDPLVKAQWKEWVKASKRPAAIGQDWSQKAFLETLKYGKKARSSERED